MLVLDHFLFGNGNGLSSPFHDNTFYWLDGRLYTYHFGYGAQMQSIEWAQPNPGERRLLCGEEFRPFSCRRSWVRVRVSWALADLPKNIDDAHSRIMAFKDKLNRV